MQVRDIMTQKPHTCRRETSLADASRRMKATGAGTLAVVDSDGRLAGILTDRDLAIAVGGTARDPGRVAVDKAMTHQVHTCSPGDDLHLALAQMTRHEVRRLPVVDRDGVLCGIISIDDIVLYGVQHAAVEAQELTAAMAALCARARTALQPET
jgi:CBS domain-containing protein